MEMTNVNENWLRNEVNESIQRAKILRDLYLERNQLYGIVIKLLTENGETTRTFSHEEFHSASKFLAEMKPSEDYSTVTVTITPIEEDKDD